MTPMVKECTGHRYFFSRSGVNVLLLLVFWSIPVSETIFESLLDRLVLDSFKKCLHWPDPVALYHDLGCEGKEITG